MLFFKREYRERGRADRWAQALENYARRWKEIEPRLPDNVRQLNVWMKRHSFHDAVVRGIERIDPKTIHIVFDGFYGLRLELLGVTSASFTPLAEPTSWLYYELDLTDVGLFVLRALLDDGDLSVTCRDIRLYSAKERRYLIPEEPKPPGPTLFAERKARPRRGRP